MAQNTNKKLGIALVGLGRYAEGQLAPALRQTQHCRLAAVVSGHPEKRSRWAAEYNLSTECLYSYENFNDLRYNTDVDMVYITLPNALHAEYTVHAAAAGKHVICEKPMAISVEECHTMISACAEAGVRLSIGYRLHFDLFNKEMMRLGQNEVFGPVQTIFAHDSMKLEKEEWRLEGALAGGGPLMNNGIYCIQAALFITGELPVAVKAAFAPKTNPAMFQTVEEGITWEMYFASGKVARCESSYVKDANLLRADAQNGWFQLEPAYEYKDLQGKTSGGGMNFPAVNQQAAQMDDFALCIKQGRESRVSGEMGLRDMEIISAIYQSARTGKKIGLNLEAYQDLIEA